MKRRLALGLTPLWLTACAGWPQPAAEATSLHMLDARPAVAGTTRRDLVLSVSMPRAAPGFDTPAMAYVRNAHALDHYATHRWADAPARMLGPLLLRTLEDSGAFRAVVPANGGLQADLRLDTEIVRLHQSFLARPSRVELTLRVQLVDLAARRVLAARYVEVTQQAPTEDAPGGVAAANAAVARALEQVAAFGVEASGAQRAR